jgi:hypothetical protein
MNSEQSYNVAGHIFKVSMPSVHPLWEKMAPYVPFLVDNDSVPITFTLRVVEDFDVDIKDFDALLFADHKERWYDVGRSNDGEYLFTMYSGLSGNCIGSMWISADRGMVKLLPTGDVMEQFTAFHQTAQLGYVFATMHLHTLHIHSSAISNSGKGFLFMGRSGTGKSTHSRLWLKHIQGSELMNDDNPVLRIVDGKAMVYGSPWSGKTACHRNISAPIGGFVRLRQSKENHIKQLSTIESYASLSTSCSGLTWDKEFADAKADTIQLLIANVRCWQLDCLPDEAAVRLCAESVRKEEPCLR